jgi:hypothetical protein
MTSRYIMASLFNVRQIIRSTVQPSVSRIDMSYTIPVMRADSHFGGEEECCAS